MNKQLITIIIPTYNRLEFLKRAVQSVIDQSYNYWQLIIVNDGSTDDTKKWCQILSDDRILYLEKINEGKPSLARNYAIPYIKGSWVAFLDSDDCWHVDKLKEQIKAAEENKQVGLIFTAVRVGEKIRQHIFSQWTGIYDYLFLLVANYITTSSVMIRTDLFKKLGGFNSKLTWAEDYDLWLKATNETQFYYLDKALIQYEYSLDSLTRNRESMTRAFESVSKLSMDKTNLSLILRGLVYTTFLIRYLRR